MKSLVVITVFIALGISMGVQDVVSASRKVARSVAAWGGVILDPIPAGTPSSVVEVFSEVNGAMEMSCSGVVVGENAILTAGHCGDPGKNYEIHFHPSTKKEISIRPVIMDPIRDPLHEKELQEHPCKAGPAICELRFANRDVAMMIFSGELPAGVEIAKMLDSKVTATAFTAYGYGLNDMSKKVHKDGSVCDISDESCQYPFDRRLRAVQGQLRESVSDGVLHVLLNNGGICSKDSGGPVFASVNGHDVLVGLVSSGNPDPKNCSQDTGMVNLWLEVAKDSDGASWFQSAIELGESALNPFPE